MNAGDKRQASAVCTGLSGKACQFGSLTAVPAARGDCSWATGLAGTELMDSAKLLSRFAHWVCALMRHEMISNSLSLLLLPIFASGLDETRRKLGDMATVRSTLLSSAPSIVNDPFDHVKRAELHPKSCFLLFLSLKNLLSVEFLRH
jgi:hypothetical protein